MKRMINLTDSPDDIQRFQDERDIREFYEKYGCDGLEYLRLSETDVPIISSDMICGVHMRSFQCWVDLWRGNLEAVKKEFGSLEQADQIYGGHTRQALVEAFRKDLEYARNVKAEYVVFHVSEVKMEESFRYQFGYPDEEVIEAAAELINELLDGQGYSFYFLMENLWWPGLTWTRPEMTEKLIKAVHYEKKGFMLDTGHLLHTNLDLKTQEEGLSYIHQILDRNDSLSRWIKGVHLNQSLTGDAVRHMLSQKVSLAKDYYERWCQVFSYIFQIDLHQPFTAKGINKLIERIQPEYLTFELISRNRKEHEQMLEAQIKSLGICGSDKRHGCGD